MKKILSFVLAALLLVSAVPTAQATTDVSNGTTITAAGTKSEAYTVTVPAAMAPGQTGNVTASGSWAAGKTLKVTCPTSIDLQNGSDKMSVGITFAGLELAGDNANPIAATSAAITIATVDTSTFFGTWIGHLSYTVELVAAEPIAYSYNDVELPDINTVWTDELKAEYPYAHIIYYTDDDIYTVRYHKEPISYTADYNGYFGCIVGYDGCIAYDAKENSWEFYKIYEGNSLATDLSVTRLVWSSHDVLNSDDNSVYLAASAPVPVYE